MPDAQRPQTQVRRGRPAVRGPRQHQDLLDAVARKINLDGPGAIVLVEIGAELGLSRSSVYYYCRDTADLAHQAYVRATTLMAQDIAAAHALSGTASARVTAFIRRVLAPDHPPMAVLSDIEFLPEAMRRDVQDANDVNVASLTGLIEAGQEAGEFRCIDAGLCAQLLLNVLSWALISLPWLTGRNDTPDRAAYIETISDLLLNGIARPGVTVAPCSLSFDELMHRPIDAFDRTQTAELKAEQIMAAASRLFNLKGVDGVKLEQISSEIGATKGAIYHHFRDKAELVERCYIRAFDIYDLIMQTSLSAQTDPLSRAMFVTHLNTQAQLSPNAPLALQPGFSKLSRGRRSEFTRRAQGLARASATNLEAAIQSGLCRPVESITASEIAAGYFLGLQRWAPAGQPRSNTAGFLVDFLLYGLRQAFDDPGAIRTRDL